MASLEERRAALIANLGERKVLLSGEAQYLLRQLESGSPRPSREPR